MFCFGSAELKTKSLLTTPGNDLPLQRIKPKFKFAVWWSWNLVNLSHLYSEIYSKISEWDYWFWMTVPNLLMASYAFSGSPPLHPESNLSQSTSSCSENESNLPWWILYWPSTFPVTLKAQHEPQAPVNSLENLALNLLEFWLFWFFFVILATFGGFQGFFLETFAQEMKVICHGEICIDLPHYQWH